MKRENITINNIPALLWGEPRGRMFIGVHGSGASKADATFEVLADVAKERGYSLLTFDLPGSGDRTSDPTPCKASVCKSELLAVYEYAKARADSLSLMACSMGAYFSLLAYGGVKLEQALLLAPLVNMERMISNMLLWSNKTESDLQKAGELDTDFGQKLYWDDLGWVREHPIKNWEHPTHILRGSRDAAVDADTVEAFVKKTGCGLEISEGSEHYFHTEYDMRVFRRWLEKHIK